MLLEETADEIVLSGDGDCGFHCDLGMFAGAGFGAGVHCLRIAPGAAGILCGGCAGRGGDGAAIVAGDLRAGHLVGI